MQNIFFKSLVLLLFPIGFILAGNLTITLVGTNPLTINIRSDTKNEEAGNISLYLYFCDDSLTNLEESGVDVSQLTGNESNQFGWTTFLEKKEIQGLGQSIEGGPWIKEGNTFTRRLLYDNADIGQQDDFWTISGIDAIVCTFTTLGPGHAFIELAGSDGLADFAGISHDVSFENQDINLSVTVPLSEDIQKEFKLYPNYPNPFNSITTIRFDIPMTGSGPVDTKIDIYNSLGQMIKTLYQDKLSAGSYEVKWDGTTNTGNNAPSGIYFVIFKADKFTQTRKVVLVK